MCSGQKNKCSAGRPAPIFDCILLFCKRLISAAGECCTAPQCGKALERLRRLLHIHLLCLEHTCVLCCHMQQAEQGAHPKLEQNLFLGLHCSSGAMQQSTHTAASVTALTRATRRCRHPKAGSKDTTSINTNSQTCLDTHDILLAAFCHKSAWHGHTAATPRHISHVLLDLHLHTGQQQCTAAATMQQSRLTTTPEPAWPLQLQS